MLATHIFDVPEIDAQHEVLFAQVEAVQEALSDEERREALGRLRELLVTHFETEESFMDAHRQKHREMLDLLESCLASAPSAGEAGASMTQGIEKLAGALRSHEFRNPNIDW